MDDKYPRKCFLCRVEIYYDTFQRRNLKMDWEIGEKIWKSPHVQLLCCTCVHKKEKIQLRLYSLISQTKITEFI